MRFKSFALGLLLSAAGSLVTTPAAAEWNAGTLTLKAEEAGYPSGSTTFIWSPHLKVFAVRFDYDNLGSSMRGRSFSGVGFLDCENFEKSRYYWDSYDLSTKDARQLVTDYTNLICGELQRLYPDSPAFK